MFSVVDLHAITVPSESALLKRSRRETMATLLAIGLKPERCSIFFQSAVPQHSELMWILSCNASMGYLSRMTQWKSKAGLDANANPLDPHAKSQLKLGLFSYPVLQAADILVHRATHVPVGEDQSQHLEFARDRAVGFNHTYGPVLVAPETLISPAKRVMSLDQPTQKMSKSHPNPKSRIQLTDDRATIQAKIRGALTDSIEGVTYDPERRPGVTNLLEIIHHLTPGSESPMALAKDMENLSMRALKERAVDVVDAELAPIRERYAETMTLGGAAVDAVAAAGAEEARASAEATMKLVREAVGM